MNRQSARVIQRARSTAQVLRRAVADRWLEVEYRRSLYGGWEREDGSVAPPHKKAIQFHEAAKALFCPWCGDYLDQIGEDRAQTFPCRRCEKTATLPQDDFEAGDWLLSGPSFSKHFPLTLNPYFEQAMSHRIVDRIKNQQKVVTQYVLDNGDRVHCLSYEQYLKAGKDQTNPYEGPRWKGALFDEPPPREVWVATKRGLLRWQSKFSKPPFAQSYQTIFIGGGNQSSKSYTSRSEFVANILGERPWDRSLSPFYGRAIFAATPLECPWLFHEIYRNAWNKGGDNRGIFAIEFDISDNPALTPKAIANFSEGLSPEEVEARLHGRFKHLSGRVFSEFEPQIHVYSPRQFDPLREGCLPSRSEASSTPVIMAIDPHYRRPWFMLWVAVMPDETFCVVREWPNDEFERMKSSNRGLDDYAAIIRDVESSFPGGSDRVLWREFDPNLGRTPTAQASASTTLEREMKDRGLFFRADVNDKIHFGHAIIHTLLHYDREREIGPMNRPRLLVSEECRNLLFAFENYTWDEHSDKDKAPKDKPKDLGKDAMDTLRYCLVREPGFMDWRDCIGGSVGHYDQAVQDIEGW